MSGMRAMMEKLHLTVNEEKTKRCQLPKQHFDFLGYNFRTVLLHDNGSRLHRHSAVEEEHEEEP